MNILWGLLSTEDGNSLADIDAEKALRKIPTKTLCVMTFRRLDSHIAKCNRSSNLVLGVVLLLAIEKLAEMLHIQHILGPMLGGD